MSQSKIYVGNLSYSASQDDLRQLFGACGELKDIRIITDRDTGRSKGFAFVTFESSDAVQAALQLNGSEFQGRQVKIDVAKDTNSGGGSSRGGRPPRGNDRGDRGGRY